MEEQMPLRFYVACMEVYGEEGRRKVERHRALRAGKGFVTLERPRGLSGLSLKGEGKKAVILELSLIHILYTAWQVFCLSWQRKRLRWKSV